MKRGGGETPPRPAVIFAPPQGAMITILDTNKDQHKIRLDAISTILVDRLGIPLWKIGAVHIASDLSSDCLFFGRPIGVQFPLACPPQYRTEVRQGFQGNIPFIISHLAWVPPFAGYRE